MSVAISMMARFHHSVRLFVSPSYRQVRQRLEAIAQPRA
jgi:hypothetical protein